jgi:hypothetical protein
VSNKDSKELKNMRTRTRNLHITITSFSGSETIVFEASKVICAGFTARNQDLARKHLEELKQLGVPVPSQIPVFYTLTSDILKTDERIYVDKTETSGEVEAVLLFGKDDVYITVGSDHTDRILEQVDIEKAKNNCPKVIAKEVWRLSEVKNHVDQLILSSYTSRDESKPYQLGRLADIMDISTLMKLSDAEGYGVVLFSGTIPTIDGRIRYSDYFLMKIVDPLMRRTIMHGYEVQIIYKDIRT